MLGEGISIDTRPSLLLRIRNLQDASAWLTFVEVYLPLIYAYTRARGVQEADASDISQHVLTRVASAIGRFEYQAERGRFRDWLGVITRNEIARFLRSHGGPTLGRASGDHQRILDQLESPPAAEAWRDDYHRHVLQAALKRIRPNFEDRTWTAFERTWMHDEPAATVAIELQWGIANVYVARSRVLAKLRTEVLALADMPLDSP